MTDDGSQILKFFVHSHFESFCLALPFSLPPFHLPLGGGDFTLDESLHHCCEPAVGIQVH
jgi:hypothetical protein